MKKAIQQLFRVPKSAAYRSGQKIITSRIFHAWILEVYFDTFRGLFLFLHVLCYSCFQFSLVAIRHILADRLLQVALSRISWLN